MPHRLSGCQEALANLIVTALVLWAAKHFHYNTSGRKHYRESKPTMERTLPGLFMDR